MARIGKVDRSFISHMFQITDSNTAATSAFFNADTLVTGSSSTVNPGFVQAVRFHGIMLHTACLVVNSVGDWTFRLRKNEATSDTFSGTFGLAALPGSKDVLLADGLYTWEAGDTYHLQCDGPSRNFIILRATVYWEVL